MASTIIQRTISGSPDNAIQLSNSMFGRQVALPAGWTTVRVALRQHATDSGANLTGTPRWAVGLGHGITNMVGDAVTDNWIGLITNVATITRAGAQYQTTANALAAATKIGAVLTTGGFTNPANIWQEYNGAAAATADRTAYWVDITRGSPNYTVTGFWHTNIASLDCPLATWLANLLIATPVISGHVYGTGVPIAFDESAGALDAVQVWWDHSDAKIEITELAVCCMA